MKKFLFVLALVAIIATGTAFADHPGGLGIGIQGGGGIYGSGGALSLKLPAVPVFWAIGADFYGGTSWIGVSGDVYLAEGNIVPEIKLDYYIGVGGFVNLAFGDNFYIRGGARIPIGLSWHFLEIFELYAQIVPYLGISTYGSFFYWNVAGNIGLRIWF